MSSSTLPVLISGAGPTGLFAALILLRNGISVRVVDKLPRQHPGSRGPGLQPRTYELFHQAGLHEIHRESRFLAPMRMYKPGTLETERDIVMVQPRTSTPHFPYADALLLGQHRSERIMMEHIAEYGVHVEYNTGLGSFEQDKDGVTVHLAKKDGDQEVSETIRAQYLIGADGARSVVRKQLGCTFLGDTRSDVRMITGDIRLAGEGLDREYWHSFGDASVSRVLLRPEHTIGDNEDGYQLIIRGEGVDFAKVIAGGQQAVYDLIQEHVPTKVEFRELIWFGEFMPNIRMADKFGEGRVFIAGDAAHCHSPTGGQGLNSSVQDAFNLAWKLALVFKRLSPPTLLYTYNTERIPIIAEMLNITTAILNLSAVNNDRGFQRPDSLRMLGVNYRSSSIVYDELSPPESRAPVPAYGDAIEGDAPLIAGDRAPDAPGMRDVHDQGTEWRMFDIFKPTRHTVLVFAPWVEEARPVLAALAEKEPWKDAVRPVVVIPASATVSAKLDGVLMLRDAEGYAYSGFRVVDGETRVVVVRPDGYVGAVVRGVEGMERYFKDIFL
ncbi:hypothetical protein CONPUDRAFT_100901 [Coniophora puteana RWD-64-598 SS2]|uniref:Uncharacterized protein n=1 Tax=Coniophora puteana (strain RWD-64-598) TaxID=741705 RepID=A0A5M3MTW4_CONPW|nr:uncharacterized protein CONPUDRAFT_100901 [Coniophora puteana RWD-64-598 SS2]EIW82598.1 hypothetical protein CONPUDRAFT_100901 [Coniophora puteana RWD-64-598 SS2]